MKDIKQIQLVIKEQNPWWKKNLLPPHLAPLTERPLAQHLWRYILSSSRLKRYLIILGPRRVGKTTIMYQTVRHLLKNNVSADKIQWVRLDHPVLMPLDLGFIVKEAIKLAKATKQKPLYLFLDELFYAENWDKWLKTFYDEHWPVIIIASSSATAALQKGKESGVGRWEEFHLPPYLLTELLQLYGKNINFPKNKKRQSLYSTIKNLSALPHTQFNFENEKKTLISYGGFPEILSEKKWLSQQEREFKKIGLKKMWSKELMEKRFFQKTQQILRSDAIERAIYKDIPQSYRIDNLINLERFLYILAGQVTGLLSRVEMSKDTQISAATLDRYLNYLIQTYLVFTLSNYASNERSVQRRYRKVYFIDVAIRNAALLKEQSQIFSEPSELGKLHENLLAGHLYHLGKQSNIRLYYWRRGKYELDFIYDDPVQPLAFEIGSSSKHQRSGLKKFLQENPKFKKGVYYVAPHLQFLSAEESSSGIGELSFDLLLFAIGLQHGKVLSTILGTDKN